MENIDDYWIAVISDKISFLEKKMKIIDII